MIQSIETEYTQDSISIHTSLTHDSNIIQNLIQMWFKTWFKCDSNLILILSEKEFFRTENIQFSRINSFISNLNVKHDSDVIQMESNFWLWYKNGSNTISERGFTFHSKRFKLVLTIIGIWIWYWKEVHLIQIWFKGILNYHLNMNLTRFLHNFLRDYFDMSYWDKCATSTVKEDKNESKLGSALLS